MIKDLIGRRVTARHYKNLAFCYLQNKYLKRTLISSIEMITTLKCNAGCNHCSNKMLDEDQLQMPFERGLQIIDMAEENKIPIIIFLGGEITLDSNIDEYISYSYKKGILPVVGTNGYLLTEDKINEYADRGLYGVGFTLHSDVPEEHDSVVNLPGAFDKIQNAIKLFKKRNIITLIGVVCGRVNYENGKVDRLIDFCAKNNILLAINLFTPVGGGFDMDNMLTNDQIIEINDKIREQPHLSSHVYNKVCNGCMAGSTYFGITPKGEYLPCYFMPICIGNIDELPIYEAQKIAMSIPIFSKRHMFCVVAESKRFYQDFLRVLYEKHRNELPIDLTKNKKMWDLLMSLDPEELMKNN